MRIFTSIFTIALLSSCDLSSIVNDHQNNLSFSDIHSNYTVTDTNKYGCKTINKSIIEHVLKTGVVVTQRDIHDFYDTTGCSINGNIKLNDITTEFTFEYGGIIYLNNSTIIGCTEECCKNKFKYCTWDKHGLSGE